jgi:hypothetical protein
MTKYKNIVIESTPTETFPNLVTMTKTPKNKSEFLGKKYITLEKAILAVDTYLAENLISRGTKKDAASMREALAFKELFCG